MKDHPVLGAIPFSLTDLPQTFPVQTLFGAKLDKISRNEGCKEELEIEDGQDFRLSFRKSPETSCGWHLLSVLKDDWPSCPWCKKKWWLIPSLETDLEADSEYLSVLQNEGTPAHWSLQERNTAHESPFDRFFLISLTLPLQPQPTGPQGAPWKLLPTPAYSPLLTHFSPFLSNASNALWLLCSFCSPLVSDQVWDSLLSSLSSGQYPVGSTSFDTQEFYDLKLKTDSYMSKGLSKGVCV